MHFRNATRAQDLAVRAQIARTVFRRLRGLLFSRPLEPGEALYLERCTGIHMIGMTYAIDAVFLDRLWRVVATVESIQPGQISAVYSQAYGCLELPAGTIAATATAVGDQIEVW